MRNAIAAALCVLCSALPLYACSATPLKRDEAGVLLSQRTPSEHGFASESCTELGKVIGRTDETIRGNWSSNEQLIESALGNLRDKAAKLGANVVTHETPELGVATDGYGSTSATVRGTAYRCENRAPKPALKHDQQNAGARARAALPEGAGGFKFESSTELAKKNCELAGHQWTAEARTSECSGAAVPMGAPARSRLTFCDEKLCEITLEIEPSAEQLLALYDELYRALVGKYGAPKQDRAAISPECAAALVACLTGAAAPSGGIWRWAEGYQIAIQLEASDAVARIRLQSANPAFVRAGVGPTL